MDSRRTLQIVRWLLAAGALAGIVLVYRRWLHVNATTVALTLLLLVLVLAAEWGLRYAVVIAIAAAACYNFFFLPPYGTFTIADTQNWIALLAFLTTALLASRLSHQARNEAREARARQRELDLLFRLSRELLGSESSAALLQSVPAAVVNITSARDGYLFLMQDERLFQTGGARVSAVEFPHLKRLAETLGAPAREGGQLQIPLRSGVRPMGLLVLTAAELRDETADAIGGLIAMSLDRAGALETLARGEAAKESERLRTLMMDSITHELRTPLTSIKGAATTLLATSLDSAGAHEMLTIIDEESDRLNQLVAEAVEMAQLDAQQVQMHLRATSVEHLIAAALEACGFNPVQHPLRIDVPPELQVRVDPMFLQKVLCNLLDNAAKYSAAGTPVVITAAAEGDDVTISVADRGAGIDLSEQPLIFERFYRGPSNASSTAGTGMGLAISRAIVLAHGGTIGFTSQTGRGSVFTLRLPRA